MDAVFDLLGRAADVTPRPVLFLCVQIGTKEIGDTSIELHEYRGKLDAVAEYLDGASAARPGLDWVHDWPTLFDCAMDDVEEWLDLVEQEDRMRVTPATRNRIRTKITRYGGWVPLGFVRECAVNDLQFERV